MTFDEILNQVLDLLRGGGDPASAGARWAETCTGSGACLEACDDGVNPRFMLALARVRRRGGRAFLVGIGVAAAAAALATVLAASLVAQDRSLARRLAELPDSSRAVRAVWLGVPGSDAEGYAALDAAARAALRGLPGDRLRRS